MIYSSFYIPVYRNKKSLKYATCQGCTRRWKGKTIIERLLMCLFNDVFDIFKEMWNPSPTHLLWNVENLTLNTKSQCLVMKYKAYVHQIGSNYEFGHFFITIVFCLTGEINSDMFCITVQLQLKLLVERKDFWNICL